MTNREKAREMKKNGKTYQQIGDELGVSRQRAQQLLAPSKCEREQLEERAHGRCEKCGYYSDKLDSHHESYNDAPSILVCTSCHVSLHARDGITRKNKDIVRKTISHAKKFPIQVIVYVDEFQAKFLRDTPNASAWVRGKIDRDIRRTQTQQQRREALKDGSK